MEKELNDENNQVSDSMWQLYRLTQETYPNNSGLTIERTVEKALVVRKKDDFDESIMINPCLFPTLEYGDGVQDLIIDILDQKYRKDIDDLADKHALMRLRCTLNSFFLEKDDKDKILFKATDLKHSYLAGAMAQLLYVSWCRQEIKRYEKYFLNKILWLKEAEGDDRERLYNEIKEDIQKFYYAIDHDIRQKDVSNSQTSSK
jgi:hypothetical protein